MDTLCPALGTEITPNNIILANSGQHQSISSLFPLGPNLRTVNVSPPSFGPDADITFCLYCPSEFARAGAVAKIRVLNISPFFHREKKQNSK